MGGGEKKKIIFLESKRLARLLRQAALAHIRREHALAAELLVEACDLAGRADRPAEKLGRDFLGQWLGAVKTEQEGEAGGVTPGAAWIHLAQELAERLERGEDWIAYLEDRWAMRPGRLAARTRAFYAALGALALFLGGFILFTMARAALEGELSLWPFARGYSKEQVALALLGLGRLLGSQMMVEHGIYWARKAVLGHNGEQSAVFLPGPRGRLTLLP